MTPEEWQAELSASICSKPEHIAAPDACSACVGDALRAAVAEEQEACARVAERLGCTCEPPWGHDSLIVDAIMFALAEEREAIIAIARPFNTIASTQIIAAIRARNPRETSTKTGDGLDPLRVIG